MALLTRNRVLAAKHETTIGTAIAVAGADATFNAYDVQIQGDIEYNERLGQGSFSRLAGTMGKQGGSISFKTGLSGNGAAASPGWLDTLLPAVGLIEATDTFSPSSTAPSTTVGTGVNHTVTIAAYENGVKKFLAGAMGNLKITGATGQNVVLEWTFTGIWQAAVDAAILAPTYDTVLPLKFLTATLTMGGDVPGCIQSLSIDLGNNVVLRECATSATGYSSAIITDRKVMGTYDPEAHIEATAPAEYTDWLAGTEEAFSVALTDGTDVVTIAMPQAQRVNVQEGDRGGVQIDTIEFAANASAAAGDDEITIDFS